MHTSYIMKVMRLDRKQDHARGVTIVTERVFQATNNHVIKTNDKYLRTKCTNDPCHVHSVTQLS